MVDDLKVASIWSDGTEVAATFSSLYSVSTDIVAVFECMDCRKGMELTDLIMKICMKGSLCSSYRVTEARGVGRCRH
jgi:hypothetical protein